MSKEQMIMALCPRCNGERKCTVHGSVEKKWSSEEHDMHGGSHHQLLECCGCSTVFMHTKYYNSEEFHYAEEDGRQTIEYDYAVETLPAIEEKTTKPDWVWDLRNKDPQLCQIMDEVYTAAQQKSFILASIGLRTAFDRTSEILKIHPGLSLGEKVEHLKTEGFIGDTEAQILTDVTEAGNGAAHRGWSPKADEFKSLCNAIESFIHRTVILERSLSHITKSVPPKQKRPPKPKNGK